MPARATTRACSSAIASSPPRGSAATSACRPRRRSASSPSGSRVTAGSGRARFACWWRAHRWRESAGSAMPCVCSTRSSGRRARDRQPAGGRRGDRRALRRAARGRGRRRGGAGVGRSALLHHAPVLRPQPHRGRAGRGEDAARADARGRRRRALRARAVHARPDAERHHRDLDPRPARGRCALPARAAVHRSPARGRDQPRLRQDPGRAARGDAGAGRDGRRDAASPRPALRGVRDPEPGRAGGHLSAPRGGARPLPLQDRDRVPERGGGGRHPRPASRGGSCAELGGARAPHRPARARARGRARGRRPERRGDVRRGPGARDAPGFALRARRLAARRRDAAARGEGQRRPRGARLRAPRGRAGDARADPPPPRAARPRGRGRGTRPGQGARGNAAQRGGPAVRVGPGRRLVRAAAAWTAAAMAVVVWPALWPALAGGLALLGALAAWDLVLLRRRPPLGLAFVGRAAEIVLTLENPAREPVSVEVMDEVPADLAAEEPRFTGVLVPPAASVTLRYPIRPSVRGDRRFGPQVALERSPLGWLRRRTVAGADAVLAVYPDATRYLRPEALAPKRVLAAMGVRPSRRRGEGMEFESLRDYVAGDAPRRVDRAAPPPRALISYRVS